MCEILVKGVSLMHSDALTELAGCEKMGDPITVQEDGWHWGSEEIKLPANGGKFILIKVPGVAASVVRPFISELRDTTGKVVARSKNNIDLNALATAFGQPLSSGALSGSLTVPAVVALLAEKPAVTAIKAAISAGGATPASVAAAVATQAALVKGS